MPSLNDLDPDVLELYYGLKTNTYKDCDDFLASNPVDFYNRRKENVKINLKLPKQKMFFGGEEVSDFEGDNDYGL